ncbi:MAG: radical SAM protein [bacterium]|nr:radical SAM protein [bacterium]
MNSKGFYGGNPFREHGQGKFQSFALEIAAGCNLQCGNCYRRPHPKRMGLMPNEFVERMIGEAKEAGFAEIVLIGGEPTLHPSLPKFVNWVLEQGLTPIVCTNGWRLADKHYCEQIALPNTTIVLHGLVPLPEQGMDRHVGISGYTEKLRAAYKNLDTLRSKGITIVAEAVVIKPFLPYLLRFHQWCRQNDYIPFIELNRRGNDGRPNDLSASPEKVASLFQQLQKWDEKHAPELTDKILTPPAYGTKCTMTITGLHVKNFGNDDYSGVYSCCAQTVRHGDLRQQSLAEILANQGMEVFKNQDEWIVGPCRSCQYYSVCRGGCRGEATLTFGCPRASCPSCWHIPAEIRRDPYRMTPREYPPMSGPGSAIAQCDNCPLQGNSGCGLLKKR